MAKSINGDSLEKEKRGRLLKDHQYEAAARARVAQLMGQAPTISGGRSRQARTAAPAPSYPTGGRSRAARTPSRESVLKVISWTKAAGTPVRQARYIGRSRDADREAGLTPLQMENEEGTIFAGREAIDKELASWNLRPNAENLSAAARKATPAERAEMAPEKKLHRNQAVHMIFSIPAQSTSDPEKLRAAVRAGLAETFGDAGHRYVFTIHTEHSERPHAHVIVKVDTEAERGGKSHALKLRPAELHTLRYLLTKHAQDRGIDVIATRREDRAETRSAILEGAEPLRADRSWHQSKKTQQGRTFEKTAPDWYKAHGAAYERRRAEIAAGASSTPTASPGRTDEAPQAAEAPKKQRGLIGRLFGRAEKQTVSQPEAPPAQAKGYYQNFANVRAGQAAKAAAVTGEHPAVAQLTAAFERSHHDPVAARSSFLEMYREAPKLAVWAAHNHPEAFGSTTGVKPGQIPTALLKQLPAADRPKAEAWGKDQELAQQHEIRGLRQARDQAKTGAESNKNAEKIRRSLELAAANAETAIKHDPGEAKDTAAAIRQLAKEITTTPPAPAGHNAAQYTELQKRVRRQDRAADRRDREKD